MRLLAYTERTYSLGLCAEVNAEKGRTMKRFKAIMMLHCIIILYSCTNICSKYAAAMEFFSLQWCLLYGLIIFILGIYALLWQQVLKTLPLNFAYANKAVTVAWGMLFGLLIFGEPIEPNHIIGAVTVLCGVVLMVSSKDKSEEKPPAQEKEGGDGE